MLRMFMRQDVAEKLGRLFSAGIVPTAQQLEQMRADRAARIKAKAAASVATTAPRASAEPENYAVVGNTAQINVCGVLAEEEDFWAWLLGIDQTTYEDIRDAFALAAADPLVTKVVLCVDSPGGYIDGLFETLAAVETFGKPITVNSGQACSAAYALASMAGPIYPRGPASVFGSVGVLCTYYVDPTQVDITSTEAPNKRPDVTTEAGKAVVRAELDALHELMVEAIVRGRKNATGKNFTVAQVNADFGRGGCLLSDDAFSAGMIDKNAKTPKRGSQAAADDVNDPPPLPAPAAPPPPPAVANNPAPAPSAEPGQPPPSMPRSTGLANRKPNPMTEEELLAQFPAVHASLIIKGAAQGQASERKRVLAHLKLAKSTGANEVAQKAIESGASTLDEDVHADYMSASMNRRAQAERQEDSDGANNTLGAASKKPETAVTDDGDKVAAALQLAPAAKKSA